MSSLWNGQRKNFSSIFFSSYSKQTKYCSQFNFNGLSMELQWTGIVDSSLNHRRWTRGYTFDRKFQILQGAEIYRVRFDRLFINEQFHTKETCWAHENRLQINAVYNLCLRFYTYTVTIESDFERRTTLPAPCASTWVVACHPHIHKCMDRIGGARATFHITGTLKIYVRNWDFPRKLHWNVESHLIQYYVYSLSVIGILRKEKNITTIEVNFFTKYFVLQQH